ncbi:MAG: SanA protein [Firmicutes bacterium HGW-Firmicutes-5]|nr:MAG: SanA protein [Firmicutes bacterium HGW-Firmicutes-5]
MLKRPGKLRKAISRLMVMLCVTLVASAVINIYMIKRYDNRILDADTLEQVQSDCILVLGAGVWQGNRPSPMLEDRLNQGIELYVSGVSNRLLMSGDHGRKDYDEVNVMKAYAKDAGIESDHIFMDHAGFSTYESMVRANQVFEVEKVVIVTQKYHLYRALYMANELGMDAYGVASNPRDYYGQSGREFREYLARVKDFFYVIARPKPTYLGEVISIKGKGGLTDD